MSNDDEVERAERKRAQGRERQRRYRERQRAGNGGKPQVRAPKAPKTPSGNPFRARVEPEVRKELAGLTGMEKRPGIEAAALAMARVLDDPVAVPQHPAAARQLVELLETLRRKKQEGASGGDNVKRGNFAGLSAVPKPQAS